MIPMVIVGGWLGSGKTTYINQLLGAATGERIAVIVNDVGELNIDSSLIASDDGETIELTNGCVCCTIGGSLGLTLKDLVDAPSPPDRIVIEASGIADPAAVAKYGDKDRLQLESILVMVDVQTIEKRLADSYGGGLYRAQLAAAGVIIPTKLDLGEPDGWQALIDAAARAGTLVSTGPVGVQTATWRPAGAVSVEAVTTWLEAAGLWRAKGYFTTDEGRWLVQAVGSQVNLTPSSDTSIADGIVLVDPDAVRALEHAPGA